jgi:hypothetical protein
MNATSVIDTPQSLWNMQRPLSGKYGREAIIAGTLALSLVVPGPSASAVAARHAFPSGSTSSAVTQSTHQVFDSLEQLYLWEDYEAIRRFLLAHPETHGPLIQAALLAPNYFGSNSYAVLRLVNDIEGAGNQELFASIITSLDPLTALDLLDAFDEDWWLAQVPSLNGILSIGIGFA